MKFYRFFQFIIIFSASCSGSGEHSTIQNSEFDENVDLENGLWNCQLESLNDTLLTYMLGDDIDEEIFNNFKLQSLKEISGLIDIKDSIINIYPIIDRYIQFGYYKYKRVDQEDYIDLIFIEFITRDTLDSKYYNFNGNIFHRNISVKLNKEKDNLILSDSLMSISIGEKIEESKVD